MIDMEKFKALDPLDDPEPCAKNMGILAAEMRLDLFKSNPFPFGSEPYKEFVEAHTKRTQQICKGANYGCVTY